MSSIRLDGRAIAAENEQWLAAQVDKLAKRAGRRPSLATILVGDHKPSEAYVRLKRRACERVGMDSIARLLPRELSTEGLIEEIEALNRNPDCSGILLQHPVPMHIDELRCFDAIDPEKDVDGVTSMSYAQLMRRRRAYACATPKGIMRLLSAYQIEVSGLDAVVVGRGPILGTPMAAMLTLANATVTVCHSRTKGLEGHIGRAQLLVAGVGREHFIKGEWIGDGAIVVDAGYGPNGLGDVAADDGLYARLRAYTPVPGGVGPMTINTLLGQTFASAHRHLLDEEAPVEPARYATAEAAIAS